MSLRRAMGGWARGLKREALTLYFVARDPRTPWLARALALVVAGYALSPIDLIPDFIPVLGVLDDLVLVPLGIWLALRLVPPGVLAHARERAAAAATRPTSRRAAAFIIALWAAAIVLAAWVASRWLAA